MLVVMCTLTRKQIDHTYINSLNIHGLFLSHSLIQLALVLVSTWIRGLNPTVWAQMKYRKEEFPFMHFTQFYILVAQRGEDRFFN